MSECSLLTPLRRDGTSQRQRMPASLDPRSALVDERSTADLLLYTGDLARLLRYYSEANEPRGDWSAFIEGDVSTLSARIGAYDAETPQADFDLLRVLAETATTADFGAAYAALLAPVFTLASAFELWRRGSIDGLQLRARLDRLIEGVLAGALQDAIRAAKRSRDLGAPLAVPTFEFGAAWGDLNPPADLALFESGGFTVEAERRSAVKTVVRAFDRLIEAAKRLRAEAPGFLADTLSHYPQHRPHAALFVAFLRVFNQARRALNELTASHLDFYYRDVLRLVPRGPVADRVHTIFELAKNLPPTLLKAGTRLNAGKDGTGVPLVYVTGDELVVNRASLHDEHGLKTVFVDRVGGIVSNIYAAPDADSDAIAPPVAGEKRWPTFGNTTNLPYGRVGFAIAAPMLWLAEGTRAISVRFDLLSADILAGRDRVAVERELAHNVVVEATGPKGWIRGSVSAQISTTNPPFVRYDIEIPASEPPVVGLDPAIHLETFDTADPVLRFVLDNRGLGGERLAIEPVIVDYSDDTAGYQRGDLVRFEGKVYEANGAIDGPGFTPTTHDDLWQLVPYAYAYKYFERMLVQRVTLTVHVTGMRGVVVENDFGALNASKPFQPFGPAPRVGSSVLVGSWEAFQKRLKNVTLHITWAGLPTSTFATYYAGYTSPPANGDLTATVQTLIGGAWGAPTITSQALFGTVAGAAPTAVLTVPLTFNPPAFPAKPTLATIRRFEPGLDRGFVRLTLKHSLLHEMFPGALANFVKTAGATQPNPPYTPTIADFSLEYTAEQPIEHDTWSREDVENRAERLFQIGPFGHQEFAPIRPASAIPGVAVARSPVPAFAVIDEDSATGMAEGTLYLGVANLIAPQNLSILFQMAEGSEDPLLPAQDVHWSYLTASGWKAFARAEILLDTTNELVGSGIVRFAIPKTATNKATRLPVGLHWLRATVRRSSAAIPKAVAVLTQAAQASFRDNGNDPRHLETPLPAGTIGKLVEREAAIKSVSQPFSSFGGRMAERDDAFRVRVAERLRHKQRAVTIFDYERLVLERFPDVYKVRCLSHTDPGSEFAPGFVRIVVVPNLRNRNAVDPLRPRLALSKLEQIRRDLVVLATDFADIQVVNPEYEEVRVRFNVRFTKGFDKGFYTGQLEQDIIRFLSPWLYDEGVDLTFGGRVHRSAILNFIDEREYVNFVTDFEMDHIITNADGTLTTRANVEEAEPTKSSAVIVPARTHDIGDDIVSCGDDPDEGSDDEPSLPPPPSLGAGVARYLGNVHTRELHDRLNLTDYCQINEIAIDRRFPFRRIEDAEALGYDFCAYCFGRERSRR